jgi:hypothetical protein
MLFADVLADNPSLYRSNLPITAEKVISYRGASALPSEISSSWRAALTSLSFRSKNTPTKSGSLPN